MKKIILSLAVVAFIAVGTLSVNAIENSQLQDPQKKEVKKVTTKAKKAKECATAKKKECCDTAKTSNAKKTVKKKKK